MSFDPYHAWLGIEPHEQPADYYRLLALPRFEADVARIARAADERMALVRSNQMGPRREHTQRLLNELSAARVCLLTAKSKAEYDVALARHLRAPPRPLTAQPDDQFPNVLSFGVSYPQPVAAPPQLPPPAPPPMAAQPVTADEQPRRPIATPGTWWLPIGVLLAAAVLLLAAVGGWTWIRPLWQPAPSSPVARPVEPTPEPPAPRQIVLMQEGSGEVIFSPATATLSGGVELQVIGTEEALTHWTTPEARAAWSFRLLRPGFFKAELTYSASATADEPAELELAIGKRVKVCELRPSGGLDQFHSDTYTVAIPAGGQHTLVVRPVKQPAGDWLILKTVRFVPVGADTTPVETTSPP